VGVGEVGHLSTQKSRFRRFSRGFAGLLRAGVALGSGIGPRWSDGPAGRNNDGSAETPDSMITAGWTGAECGRLPGPLGEALGNQEGFGGLVGLESRV
jgi:hypothetical protein